MKDLEGLKKLARDVYHNRSLEFEGVRGNDVLRNLIMDKIGGKDGKVVDYYAFEEHKNEIFEILSVAVDAVVPEILTNQFDQLVDFRNVAVGQKPVFKVSDPRIVRVSRIASGTQDLRRQTITSKNYTIETGYFGSSVYAELEQFLAGEIDWSRLVDNVAQGFSAHLEQSICDALYGSYDALRANDKYEGAFKLEELVKLAQRIQTKSRQQVAVYGTKMALGKVAAAAQLSENMKDEMNKYGYLGTVNGLKLIEIPQAFKANTEEFAIDDNTLLVLPQGQKVIGVVLEGQALVHEGDRMDRNDMQLNFVTEKKLGVGVLQMKVYGMAKITG